MTETATSPQTPGLERPGLVGRLLPIVEPNIRPDRAIEVVGPALRPSDFTMDGIDIYPLTYCNGAGSDRNPRLCSYCFLSPKQLRDGQSLMNLDTFDTILAWAGTEGSPIKTISLLGGEFALHPDAKAMIQRVYDAGFGIHIVTNGSFEFRQLLCDDEVAAMMMSPGRDNLVAISLDSLDEKANDRHRGEGAMHNALRTMALCNAPGREIPFRINVTATRDAIAGLEQLYASAHAEGACEVLVHFPSSVGRAALGSNSEYSYRSNSLRFEVPQDGDGTEEPSDWEIVQWTAEAYNSKYDYSFVKCETGYSRVTSCPLMDRAASLQFTPPTEATGDDLPVVACGLSMAKAESDSAYIFRGGRLYARKGGELDRARQIGLAAARCPLQTSNKNYGCIYERVDAPSQPLD